MIVDEPGRGLKKQNMVKNKKNYINCKLDFSMSWPAQLKIPLDQKLSSVGFSCINLT